MTDMPEGRIFYGKAGDGFYFYSLGIAYFTDDRLKKNDGTDYTPSAYIGGAAATAMNPYNWIPITMRLLDAAKEVASYDICRGGVAGRDMRGYKVEGSQDGTDWQLLKDVPYDPEWTLPELYTWYSDGSSFTAGENRKVSEGKGFAIAGHPEVSSLANVRSVRVEPGAVLRTTDDNVGPISRIAVSTAGSGTIDGFKIAANGIVDIVSDGIPEAGFIPLSVTNTDTAGNLRSWTATVNGQACPKRSITVTEQGVRILEYGTILLIK